MRPSESGLDTRRRAAFSELPPEGAGLVVKLANERLLVTNQYQSASGLERTVEVAHEALISNWSTLRAWVNIDREFLLWRQRLGTLLTEWERAQESDEALLRGPLLSEAQKWFDQRSQDLSDQERKFISASRALRERLAREERERQERDIEAARRLAEEQKRRAELSEEREKEQKEAARKQRRLAIAAAVILLATSVFMWRAAQDQARIVTIQRAAAKDQATSARAAQTEAERQRQVAIEAERSAREQAKLARAAEKSTSEVASQGNVSLARYSHEAGNDAQALAHLAQALRLNERNYGAGALTAAMLTQTSWPLPGASVMRHEPDLMRHGFGITAKQAWEQATAARQGLMRGYSRIISAQFSSDGQRVMTASYDTTTWQRSTARLWDAETGKQIGEPMKQINSAQFSPDGQRVVTVSEDKTARLWDAATAKEIGEPMKHEGDVNSAQFSPDGQRLVTASKDKAARLWDVPIINSKHTAEDVLLLADLAEATGGVTLQTSGQAAILNSLTAEQVRTTREKIAARFAAPSSKLTPLQRFRSA